MIYFASLPQCDPIHVFALSAAVVSTARAGVIHQWQSVSNFFFFCSMHESGAILTWAFGPSLHDNHSPPAKQGTLLHAETFH
jgi:hypothetical protein